MALRRSTGHLDKMGGNKTNMVTNGQFDTDASGWTALDSTISVVGNELVVTETGSTNAGKAYQDITTRAGRIYKLMVSFKKGSSATGKVLIGTPTNSAEIHTSEAYSDVALTEKTFLFIATESTTRITLQSDSTTAGETSIFDNIVCEELIDGFMELYRNCKIYVYTGAQPASANNAKTGTLLYTLTKDGDGITGLTWGESVNGVISKEANESWKGTAVAAGIAGWFRCVEEGGDPDQASTTEARFDGAIATSNAEATMSNLNIEVDAVQTATSFTYTQQDLV